SASSRSARRDPAHRHQLSTRAAPGFSTGAVTVKGALTERVQSPPKGFTMQAASLPAPRILVADDQRDVIEALRLLLKPEGYDVRAVSSPSGVLEALQTQELDAALIDLNYTRDTTSGQEGLDLLSHIQTMDSTFPVIVMTAWGSVDVAVEAMRRGARDFIQKPWDNPRLLAVLRTQTELAQALRRGQRLEAENLTLRDDGASAKLPQIVAESPAMKSVLNVVQRIGPADANVLITGENGTGKEVIARSLHAVSSRSVNPPVSVNAGAL